MSKKIYFLLLSVFLSLTYVSAQVVQTLNVPQGGGLATAIGSNLKKVTDLTLTGTINATDFQTIKQMTALKNLDMSMVNVVEKAIPANAFQNRVLNSLELPEGLEIIGDGSFSGCQIAQKLVLPSSVKSIYNWAFRDMKTEVSLSKIKTGLIGIGVRVFNNYTGSKELDFSDFTSLKNYSSSNQFGRHGVFSGYAGHVILPNNMVNMPELLFCEFRGTVTLPKGLKSTGTSSFENANIPSLELPEGLEIIGDGSFSGCQIAQKLVLPSSVKSIYNWAFRDMKTEVSLSKIKTGLIGIGVRVFNNYTGSKELDFSDFTSLKNYSSSNQFGRHGVFSGYAGHVILPNNMVNMPELLFCEFRGTVTLPKGLKSTGTSSFENANIPSLELPEGLEIIGDGSFSGCQIAQKLVLPSSVKSIYNWAFRDMKTEVSLSKIKTGLIGIGVRVFNNYTGSKELDFSDFTSLKNYSSSNQFGRHGVFSGYAGHVILPNNMVNMPELLFCEFRGTVTLPKGLKSTGTSSFENANIPSLELPEGLEIIGDGSFSGCQIAQKLVLPSSVKSIYNWAFRDMKTEVSLSKIKTGLIGIGVRVFNNYTGSKELDFSDFTSLKNYSSSNQFGRHGVFSGYAGHVILPNNMVNMPELLFCEFRGTVTLPKGLKSTGTSSFENANIPSLELPEGLEIIGDGSFSGCQIAQKLVLPSSVKSIYNWAFRDMKTEVSLSKIKTGLIGIGVRVFNNYTGSKELDFSDFTSLKNYSSSNQFGRHGVFSGYAGHVILPNNMVNMPELLFCEFRGTVTLPKGLKSTGTSSFENANIPSLELPEGLEIIGDASFNGCQIAQKLVLPSSVKSIYNWAFRDTKTEVSFSKIKTGLTTIGVRVFNNYTGSKELDFSDFTSLKNYSSSNQFGRHGVFSGYAGHVILPNNMVDMPELLFYEFRGTVDLSDGLKTVGNYAFQNSTITSIDLPSSVTSIGTNAFYNATRLDTIVSRNTTPPALGSNVFYGVNKETTLLKVPDSSIRLYGTAAQWKDFLNVNATIPNDIDVQYIQYRHDNGKTDIVDYHAVRIGEYYWIDKNFHHDIPYVRIDPYIDSGVERNNPMTQEGINKYMPKAGLDPADFQVDMNDFNKYYGIYYSWYSTIYMDRYAKIQEKGKVDSRWGLPSEGDALQLVAMADSYNEPYNDGNTVAAGLGAQLNTNPLAFDIQAKTSDSPFKTGWFTLAQAHTGSARDLHFNLMPGGARLNGDTPWDNGVYDPETGYNSEGKPNPHIGKEGDIYHLFYAAGFWLKDHKSIYIDDYVYIYKYREDEAGNPIQYSPWHWFNTRYTRRLTDEELGYKLYKNDAKEDIVKLGLTETPPAGYTELEPGYLRGYYVKYIINGEKPDMTPADLYYKLKHYTNKYRSTEDPTTRNLISDDVTVPFKTDGSVTLYPNPVQEVLNISGDGVEKVSIYDMTGRQVLTANKVNSVSVSNLKTGTYIVKVLTTNGQSTHKILKK